MRSVCILVDFGKEFLSHPHSKRNEREQKRREPEIQTHFSFFVCDFFLFICICTFVCAPSFCLQKSCYYILWQNSRYGNETHSKLYLSNLIPPLRGYVHPPVVCCTYNTEIFHGESVGKLCLEEHMVTHSGWKLPKNLL